MAIVSRTVLKSYFETDDIPTQAQFIDLIDTLLSLMDYDANTILQATADNTPVAITIAEQRLLGRITGGNITALTAAEIRTLLVLAESDSVKFLDVDATELSNKNGDLKIQPDVQGDVELFSDIDVADNADGKSFYIRRRAAEGDSALRIYIDQFKVFKIQTIGGGDIYMDSFSQLRFNPNAHGNILMFENSNITTPNRSVKQWGYLTAPAAKKFISWLVDDTTDKFILNREDSNILGLKVDMPLEVTGSVQIGTDVEAASAAKVGTTRYRSDANNSWKEMVMQTGSSTYTWLVIKTNNW